MREEKGRSVISFPDDYTVIDIETTGLSPLWDEIIELAAIRYRNRRPIETFHPLVKPQIPINAFITMLTGISNEMVKNSPGVADVIGQYLSFIGDDVVVGHNVSFDINFIYDASVNHAGKPFTNDYINTVRFANKLLPDLQHRTLGAVCQRLGISPDGAHRALKDCELTNQIFQCMISMIDDKESFLKRFKKKPSGNKWTAKDILANPSYVPDEESDIYGKAFCFTGKLDQMPRKEACQIVVNMGGKLTETVTKKTNYLVLGCTDYCKTIKDGKTSKQKKAEKLQQEGSDISVITEDVFYQMIESY